MRGDRLLRERVRLLLCLYESGAAGFGSAMDYDDLKSSLGLGHSDLGAVIESAEGGGLLEVSGVAVTFAGTSYSAGRFWLTGAGLDEASRRVAKAREDVRRSERRPLGFRDPGEEEG